MSVEGEVRRYVNDMVRNAKRGYCSWPTSADAVDTILERADVNMPGGPTSGQILRYWSREIARHADERRERDEEAGR